MVANVLKATVCQSSDALSDEGLGLTFVMGHRLFRLCVFTYKHNSKYKNFRLSLEPKYIVFIGSRINWWNGNCSVFQSIRVLVRVILP